MGLLLYMRIPWNSLPQGAVGCKITKALGKFIEDRSAVKQWILVV